MSSITASYRQSGNTLSVDGVERISFDLTFASAFDRGSSVLADAYRAHGRALMIVDADVDEIYGERAQDYFAEHGIELTRVPVHIAETEKSLATVVRIIDAFDDFGLLRTEPVLVVGGGLTTDPAGFAAASYRRGTPYIRVPTTLIGLIDASVAIKVAVNHRELKNRLGAYHASGTVVLDFGFLATLPEAQIRNGMAELVKIAVVGSARIFELLETHGEALLSTRFGYGDGGDETIRAAGEEINRLAITTMLDLEVPNLHEIDLDRVIAYGHTWSPTLELSPELPMLHGHSVTVDMALSATLAARRDYITEEERDRILGLMNRLGLAVDSPYLTPELLQEATRSIIKTRDGKLRAPVPRPIGVCHFINDLADGELEAALVAHRELVGAYPDRGEGTEVFLPVGSPAV